MLEAKPIEVTKLGLGVPMQELVSPKPVELMVLEMVKGLELIKLVSLTLVPVMVMVPMLELMVVLRLELMLEH